MQMIRLKNGQEEAAVAVTATMMSLRSLEPMHLYELVMKCRDRDHKFFGNTGEVLSKWALAGSDGRIHDTIRNVVLSAVEGDGLDMTLGSPVAAQVAA